VNGLGGAAGFGEGVLGRNDDSSTGPIDIRSIFGPSGINFFGTNYTSLFVNNNGNITFTSALSDFTPSPIGTGLSFPIIAAYWFDIDTRGGVLSPTPGGTSTGSNLVYYDLDITTHTFTVTWDDVGWYSFRSNPINAFQLQLIDQGGGDFDIIFNYETIGAAGPADADGPGDYARAGYSPGGGRPGGFELPGSGNDSAVLQFDTNPGNTGVPGSWMFQVRGGQVLGGNAPDPLVPPRPVSFSVQTLGLQREGNSGATPFDVVIRRGGGDLDEPSVVDWQIVIDDPADLVPGQALSGTAIFAPFQATVTVPVSIAGDRAFEPDDMMRFQLTNVTFGDESWDPDEEGAAIIVNDDPATAYSFSGAQLRAEGQAGETAFDFVVLRTGDVSVAANVDWQLDFGTADALDLGVRQSTFGTVSFAPGQAQATIVVQVAGDTRPEPDETFTLRLVSSTTRGLVAAQTATAVGTILDDDIRQSVLAASPTAVALPEGDQGLTTFSFTLFRVGDSTTALDLPYAVALPTGGAVEADLAGPLSGLVSFAAGASQATLTVLVQGDTRPEVSETFLVNVSGAPGINGLQLTGMILNDDKVLGSAAGSVVAAPLADVSIFMQQLAGGGLWSDAGLF
jgi:hypothetical protein